MLLIKVRQHFRVRLASEYMATQLQIMSKFSMIVDLAIEDSPNGSIFVGHRLSPCGTQIDDAETRVNQGCFGP